MKKVLWRAEDRTGDHAECALSLSATGEWRLALVVGHVRQTERFTEGGAALQRALVLEQAMAERGWVTRRLEPHLDVMLWPKPDRRRAFRETPADLERRGSLPRPA